MAPRNVTTGCGCGSSGSGEHSSRVTGRRKYCGAFGLRVLYTNHMSIVEMAQEDARDIMETTKVTGTTM